MLSIFSLGKIAKENTKQIISDLLNNDYTSNSSKNPKAYLFKTTQVKGFFSEIPEKLHV